MGEVMHDLGEKPLCCQVTDALHEAGEARMKELVQAMVAARMPRDEINEILMHHIVPAFNDWVATQRAYILEAINESNYTKH